MVFRYYFYNFYEFNSSAFIIHQLYWISLIIHSYCNQYMLNALKKNKKKKIVSLIRLYEGQHVSYSDYYN